MVCRNIFLLIIILLYIIIFLCFGNPLIIRISNLVRNVWCVEENHGININTGNKKTKRNSLASPTIQRKAFVKAPPNPTSPKVSNKMFSKYISLIFVIFST